MKEFDQVFDDARGTLQDIRDLVTEAGGEFNEAQEERAHELLNVIDDKMTLAYVRGGQVLKGLDELREQRQRESDERSPIELPVSSIPADVQQRMDKITSDATASIQASIDDHTSAIDTLRGEAPGGVQTVATGNVVDGIVHGDDVELATSEGALQVHSTGDGSRVIAEEGEGLKILDADNGTGEQSEAERIAAEVFPDDQSPNPDATVYTSSPTADAPADAAAHIAGQEEVIRESHPEGDTTAK